MRITETRMLQMMGGRTMETQSAIAKAATEVSTGVAVQKPSDDPVKWADGMRTKLSMDRRDMHESTIERARDNLNRTEVALSDVVDRLGEIRNLALLGASESYTAEGRAGAALEVEALFESMLSSVNVRSADGEYLLSGSVSDVPPFDLTGAYQGNDVTRSIEVGDNLYKDASVTGSVLTGASGIDIFGLVLDVRDALAANNPDQVQGYIGQLGLAIEQAAYATTDVGIAASSLDQSLDTLSDLELSLTESLEDSVGADPIEAATLLANLGNQLEASRLVSERIVSMMALQG
jgi:flagellar hook-associated protein 3 FlgL